MRLGWRVSWSRRWQRTVTVTDVPAAVSAALRLAGVGQGSRLCCALSGGVDSVVLFEALRVVQGALGFSLSAAHVHHGLSGNAPAWAEACRVRCAQAGVPFQILAVEVVRDGGQGLEAAARSVRLAALRALPCDWLVFGHHQDDQAETLLFRLFRGAGVRGASAMQALQPAAGGVPGSLRPLLGLRRAQIVGWARACGLDWVEDESNADLHFTRNVIRHRLLPVAGEIFPAAVPALARAAANFAEADTLLGALAEIDLQACGGEALSRTALRGLSAARQANLVRWRMQAAGVQAPPARRLAEALRQLDALPAERALDIGLGAWALRAYRDRVWLEPAQGPLPAPRAWVGEAVLPWAGDSVRFESVVGEGLSLARLEGAAQRVLAPRQVGMRLRLSAQRPRRELRKLCQEAGIPVWLRERLPVLWVDGVPAWVGGLGGAVEFSAAEDEPGVVLRWPAG